jgi:DeoR/GlpR family transcriptional regulator of sugar metabolism
MNARLEKIMSLITRDGEVSVGSAAKAFGVTEMTIRRDLETLERDGRLVRTYGGAVLSRPGIVEFAFQQRADARSDEKRAIARDAARLVRPGMSVSIDTGTTTLEVAKAISGTADLRVLTPSLAVASALYAFDGIELVLLGGTARKGSPDLQGEITEDNIKRFRVHLAVLGADALGEDGIYTKDAAVSRVSRAMIANARERLVVADSSKLSETAFVKFADWKDVDVLITDAEAPPAARRWLNKSVKKVIYART